MEIPITAVGEYAICPQLICHSDLTNGGLLGQWRYPDGSMILTYVNSVAAGQDFYVYTDDINPHSIGLNRRELVNPLTPTGSYCCTVPTTGGEMTLCANLGEWIV